MLESRAIRRGLGVASCSWIVSGRRVERSHLIHAGLRPTDMGCIQSYLRASNYLRQKLSVTRVLGMACKHVRIRPVSDETRSCASRLRILGRDDNSVSEHVIAWGSPHVNNGPTDVLDHEFDILFQTSSNFRGEYLAGWMVR